MKNLFLFVFLVLFFSIQTFGQVSFNNSSGCKKILVNPEIGFGEEYEFAVFTGKNTEGIDLVELVCGSGEPTTKWVKKKADTGCLSADPEDCLVWCLVEQPGAQEKFQIVIDKTQTTEFKTRIFPREKILEMEGFFEEKRILCNSPRKRMSRKICRALQEKGYFPENDCRVRRITDELAKALIKFQTDNNLFTGGLSLETLDLLGVKH